MKPKLARLNNPWVMLLLATLLAGGVAYLAYSYLQHREARIKEEVAAKAQRKQVPKVAVVVPMEDVREGTVLAKGLFVARPVETDLVYPGTLLAEDFDRIEGQKLARPVLKGRPVRLTDLQTPEIRDVASVLPKGTRALTIDIDNVNSISQSLRPGHRVDVFLISRAEKLQGSEVSEQALNQASLFMQDMQVLATGKEFQDIASPRAEEVAQMVRPGEVQGGSEGSFDTVTLLVTPAEAAKLLVGQKMGSYRIALRGRSDDAAVALAPLRGLDLLPAKQRSEAVEMIVGGGGGQNGALMPSLQPVSQLPGRIAQTQAQAQAMPSQAAIREALATTISDMTKPKLKKP